MKLIIRKDFTEDVAGPIPAGWIAYGLFGKKKYVTAFLPLPWYSVHTCVCGFRKAEGWTMPKFRWTAGEPLLFWSKASFPTNNEFCSCLKALNRER